MRDPLMATLSPLLRHFGAARPPKVSILRSDSPLTPFLCPWIQVRGAKKSSKSSRPPPSAKAKRDKEVKKRKKYSAYKTEDLRNAQQYTLCDAMR